MTSTFLTVANAGLPMIVFFFPALLWLGIPIVLVEAALAKELLRATWKSALRASLLANAISTCLGIPLTWGLLVGIQMLTNSGGFLSIESRAGMREVLFRQAAWLPPYPDAALEWLVPRALTILVVIFFCVSVGVEYPFFRSVSKSLSGKRVLLVVGVANLASYAVAVAAFAIWWSVPAA